MTTIHVSVEGRRGCGYRHTGKDGFALYLVGSAFAESCERLPFPLTVCPCCGAGITFTRGVQRICAEKLFAPDLEPKCCPPSQSGQWLGIEATDNHHHKLCFLCSPAQYDNTWLMWVGRQFYTTRSFTSEALARGVSKRINALPRGLVPGESIVYLAHLDAVEPWLPQHPEAGAPVNGHAPKATPGVFMVFRPELEIVVDTTDPDELPPYAVELAEKFGDNARLVKVTPEACETQMALEAAS